ncbi:MAG TPA: hypothetical protein DHV16_04930 [Nitrospiraceae bacterium]|nr:MAG: hypothetical protein A2Z82_01695 [Nitrospirae bacterium GWA2_46_11]OGW25448.1 MAG: hypothetical protein A2X55_12460 [Nitrospirae bacterium GWB2_47_37]HAK87901.1 hypothetical protein [Nitrospiraceae bacterium]HCZ11593.1 hypothetical protein [Nitrospiraceae bacterium]
MPKNASRSGYKNFLSTSEDDCLLTAKVYPRDVQIKFSTPKRPCPVISEIAKRKAAKRSKIIHFSNRSAKRLRHVIRNSESLWKVFITLTYPESYPCNGKETKKHFNAFLQCLRRKGIKFVWVLEFQARGAPHYHIIASGFIPKEELSERWYKIVGSGDENHLKAGTQIQSIKSKKHLYGYLSNYIKKLSQKIPPKEFEAVGRFWGASRNILVFEMFQSIGHYYKLSRMIKLLRRWYKAHLRGFGIKWKWKGQGFTALDGALPMKKLKEMNC